MFVLFANAHLRGFLLKGKLSVNVEVLHKQCRTYCIMYNNCETQKSVVEIPTINFPVVTDKMLYYVCK